MLAYSPAELRALDFDRPPLRAVRKTLFSLRLWRPAYARRRSARQRSHAAPSRRAARDVNKQHRRSADRQMAIGWLNVQSLTNKTGAVSALISDRKLDVIELSETWHSGSNDVTPDNYAVADSARTTGRGGGVAVIFRKSLRCSRVPLPSYVTFKSICVRLTTASGPIVLLNVYRPGSARPSAAFYDEMASVLEQLVVFSCPVVVGGDINIHVHDADDPDARRLHELLESFEMTQHVNAATHNRGGTLDLVMTFAGLDPSAAAEFAVGNLSAENPPEKLRRAELAAEF